MLDVALPQVANKDHGHETPAAVTLALVWAGLGGPSAMLKTAT